MFINDIVGDCTIRHLISYPDVLRTYCGEQHDPDNAVPDLRLDINISNRSIVCALLNYYQALDRKFIKAADEPVKLFDDPTARPWVVRMRRSNPTWRYRDAMEDVSLCASQDVWVLRRILTRLRHPHPRRPRQLPRILPLWPPAPTPQLSLDARMDNRFRCDAGARRRQGLPPEPCPRPPYTAEQVRILERGVVPLMHIRPGWRCDLPAFVPPPDYYRS